MKILLLNENPVVNKLVTLSAQKTSDELEVVKDIDTVGESSYDLVVIDDTVYTPELLGELQEKITFSKSLYICSRNAQEDDNFTRVIKKPFLPTDLVELFSSLGREVNEIDLSDHVAEVPEESVSESSKVAKVDELEELNLDNDLDLEDLDSSEELSLDDLNLDDINLDDDLDITDFDELEDLSEMDDISLDDELSDTESEGVLDKDDLQEVQDLLDEVNEENSSETSELDELEDLSLDAQSDLEDSIDLEDELDLSEEVNEETSTEPSEISEDDELDELNLDSDIELDEELDFGEDELSLEETSEETSSESSETSQEDELEDFSLDDDIDLEDELELSDELDLSEELSEETPDESSEISEEDELDELSLDSDTELDEKLDFDDDKFSLEETTEEILSTSGEIPEEDELEDFSLENDLDLEELSLEAEIENAVGKLSQEDLDSELDEETLLDMVASDMDGLDSLNARDLQVAIGEEVSVEESLSESSKSSKVDELAEFSAESDKGSVENSTNLEIQSNQGVESLKKLLAALSNEDIAASMKGMKISINIELGDSK